MYKKRKEINEVFTPRNDTVNTKMYIHRPSLEENLKRKINGSKHVVVYGESGCGKSWLYKNILNEGKIRFGTINLSKAKRLGSITNVFQDELSNRIPFIKSEYQNTSSVGGSAVIRADRRYQEKYQKLSGDPVREYIKSFNDNNLIIILENLESIFSKHDLMEELGDILTLLDDSDYNAKFIIVGVPSGVVQYFNNRELLKTIANRMVEVPEVKGLSEEQVKEFLVKGFIEQLKVGLTAIDIEKITKYVFWITNGTPQKLQEFCEILAYKIKSNDWNYDNVMLEKSSKEWVSDALHRNYTLISNMMNSIETDLGRRNQVLYCLGKINTSTFKASEIEQLLRGEFPNTTKDKKLNVSLILNDLESWSNSFIQKNNGEYLIKDKQSILCIRIMLKKNTSEKIEKMDITELNNI
ncbi:AAA family ATPase [Cytobacillus sp. FJAT-54145]|uniref:AAA family ATPase n=1 Tax=Cytobacillus spartinae TaxID=3299023 RepID=A0ABW6KIA7_9BACI